MLSKSILKNAPKSFTPSLAKQIARTCYNMTYLQKPGSYKRHDVTLIPGTYIGPEATNSVRDIFEASLCPIDFKVLDNFDFDNVSDKLKLQNNPAVLIGNLGHEGDRYIENVNIYKLLDLYVKVMHTYHLPNVKTVFPTVDMVVVKDNIEGEYSGIEHEVYPGVFESIKKVTEFNSRRLAEYAFEHAFYSGRQKVTCIHKANIMKIADGLFLQTCREVSQKYPSLDYEEMIVDNACMQMMSRPDQFDVIVTTNLYGSILGSIAAGLAGGPGVVAGANFGPEYMMFEGGTRNSGHSIAGKNIANPTSAILSSINMLRALNLPRFAELINQGLHNVYKKGEGLTRDVGGKGDTKSFTKLVIKEIENLDKRHH